MIPANTPPGTTIYAWDTIIDDDMNTLIVKDHDYILKEIKPVKDVLRNAVYDGVYLEDFDHNKVRTMNGVKATVFFLKKHFWLKKLPSSITDILVHSEYNTTRLKVN